MTAPKKTFRYTASKAYYPSGGGYVYVEPGSLILYVEAHDDGRERTRLGRVLDSPTVAPNGPLPEAEGPWLRVLAATDDLHFGYIRYVRLDDVRTSRAMPSPFAEFFFSEELPKPETVVAMDNYGSLSDDYVMADLKRRRVARPRRLR
jgi:hypothetical protein